MNQPQPLDKSLHFVNSFWGPMDSGFPVLQERLRNGRETLKSLLRFYEERIQIEKEHNKKLERLNGKIQGSFSETGTLKKSLDALGTLNKQMIKDNEKFVKSIALINLDKLNTFYSIYTKKTDKIEHHMGKIHYKLNESWKSLEMVKQKYQDECSLIKSYCLRVKTTWGKELEKNESKLRKLRQSNPATKKHYLEAIQQFKDINQVYLKDWSLTLGEVYQLEVERIQICKINCFSYCNNIATLCVDHDQAVDHARSIFAKVSPPQDLQDFSDYCGTGNKIYSSPNFIDFMLGVSDTGNETGHTVATFESPDHGEILSRSYSSYPNLIGAPSHKEMNHAANYSNPQALTPVQENSEKLRLAPYAEDNEMKSSPETFLSPASILPSNKAETDSVTSKGEDSKNEVFSLNDKNERKGFGNSNGSNYSNPTNYTSTASDSSNKERNWASPRKKGSQFDEFQQQIGKKTKQLPPFPKQYSEPSKEERKTKVPILKDFSIDFIAQALNDLKAGGDGDINKYRRSLRSAGQDGSSKTAPTTPFNASTNSERYLNEHDEVATRFDPSNSLKFRSSGRLINSDETGSPTRVRRIRPRSMLDPVTSDVFSPTLQKNSSYTQGVGPYGDRNNSPIKLRRSLLKSPTKSYCNLHDLVNNPANHGLTPSGNSYIAKAKSLYSFKPQQDGEMYFKKGWFMYILHKQEDSWFVCELAANTKQHGGKIGLVPANYIIEGDSLF